MLDDLEYQDARKALAAPAVLDPTSLSVLAGLGGQIEQAALRALPGSVIAQATLEDADRAAGPLGDPVGPAAYMARDPRTGEPTVVPIDETQVARQAEHQREHLRIARTLRIEPDTDPEPRDEIEKALAGQDGGIERALSTWAATLAVASRTGLPVLSDDRRVRISARQSGIPNFSTETLLRVLVQAGDVDEAVLADARERLLRRGALGLHPSSEELAALAREAAFEPSRALYCLLTDPAFWVHDPAPAWAVSVRFLAVVHGEAHEKLERWVARVIDAAKRALPHVELDILCFGLLATVWGWTSPAPERDGTLLRAVIVALRRLDTYIAQSPRYDPVEFALARFAQISARAPQALRAVYALRAISLLGAADQLRAIKLLFQ